MDSDHVSILLDIKSEIGSLSARMMDASRSRERMEKSIEEVKASVADIKPVVAVVADMKPEHDDLMKFKDRIGGYVWFGGAVAAGALWLLWQGVVFFSDNIRAGVARFFH
jgi:hypothetical protein